MKKFLCFLLFALCLTVAANAQSSCETPTNVTVTPGATSATVSWTGSAGQYNVQYLDLTYYCGADGDCLDGWTIYDQDGDGYNWGVMHAGRSGDADDVAFYSESYNLIDGELDPDNWLVTPVIDLGGTMSVWMKSYSPSWPDTFAIYLTTNPNFSSVADFTITLVEKTAAPSEYTEYTADLSAYAGMRGAIAIRHFDSHDQYMLLMDDFSVNGWTLVSNVSSPVEITNLYPKSPFQVQVQAVCSGGVSEWTDPVAVTTHGLCDAPSGLEASNITGNTATLEWTGYQMNYNVQYAKKPAIVDTLFFEDFENGLPSTWTTIDNDGDGYNWTYHSNVGLGSGLMTTHSGDGLVYSESYYNNYELPLTPDNWLITPQIDLNGIMRVWIRGQDPSYASEHFAIYLSTSGNTVGDFTTLLQEADATGEYVEYTADLSAYAGQRGYIAIRHFNITDMFILNVDDFGVFTDPWTTVTASGNSIGLTGLDPETTYIAQVQGVCADGSTTEWSEALEFTTTDEVVPEIPGECGIATDCDGHDYPTVKIGDVCWMTKNLAVESCVTSGNVYSYVNDQFPDETANVTAYGKLYDLAAAMQGIGAKASISLQSICPAGWQLPTTDQIEELKANYTADELRNSTGWLVNSGTNGTGFSWDGSGFRNGTSSYYEHLLLEGYLWAVDMTSGTPQPALYKMMCGCNEIFRVYDFNGISASIRCVKTPETFTCGTSKMKDANDNEYETMLIGTQCWTKTNLRATKDRNGNDFINGVSAAAGSFDAYADAVIYIPTVEKWNEYNSSVTYNNNTFGYYYNWTAANNVCPVGWHLPSDEEWTTMEQTQTSMDVTGSGLRGDHAGKLAGGEGWNPSTTAGAPGNASDPDHNASGFSAVPAGGCYGSSLFGNAGYDAYFWSATQNASILLNAYTRYLDYSSASVGRYSNSKSYGYSVRCLRDSE